jgi:hypothetical protein
MWFAEAVRGTNCDAAAVEVVKEVGVGRESSLRYSGWWKVGVGGMRARNMERSGWGRGPAPGPAAGERHEVEEELDDAVAVPEEVRHGEGEDVPAARERGDLEHEQGDVGEGGGVARLRQELAEERVGLRDVAKLRHGERARRARDLHPGVVAVDLHQVRRLVHPHPPRQKVVVHQHLPQRLPQRPRHRLAPLLRVRTVEVQRLHRERQHLQPNSIFKLASP